MGGVAETRKAPSVEGACVHWNKSRLGPPCSNIVEQTSGCYSVGAFNYKAIYALAPVELTVLELP